MRVALYARVSDPRNRDASRQDTENQLLQLREYAEQQQWETIEYVDRKTGNTGEREQLQKLFDDAESGKFDMVMFWSLDRLSREGVLVTLQYLQRLSAYKIKWKSLTQDYLTNVGPFGDVIVALLATLAQQERLALRDRVIAGVRKAQKYGTRSGKPIGRPENVEGRKEALRLRDVEELSFAQIGKRLGVTHTQAFRLVQKARRDE